MASTVTTRAPNSRLRVEEALFSSLESQGLAARLFSELSLAFKDFRKDPLGFLRESFLVDDDKKNIKRRRLLARGLLFAALLYIVGFVVILKIGLRAVLDPTPKAANGDRYFIQMLTPVDVNTPYAGNGDKRSAAKGGGTQGGGGGDRDPNPVSKGPLPQMLPIPQIVRPNPSNVTKPDLPVPSTLLAQDVTAPPPPVPPGLPNGKEGEFSGGPGKRGGMGNGNGQGAGDGGGPGAGKGSGGGTGNSPGGDPNGKNVNGGVYDFRLIDHSGFRNITWLHRPTPEVTPEAIQNKVQGQVLLRATFRSDGTITDIQVIMPVDFMTESAIESLKHSRFRPATVNGFPITLTNVPVKIEVSVDKVMH